MQTIAMRQRSFTGVWWSWWRSRARQWQWQWQWHGPARREPQQSAPLPEQDPGSPIYHDAQLW